MKVYHLTYDHQWDGHDYGLFDTLQKAEALIKKFMRTEYLEPQVYMDGKVRVYPGNYRIEEKSVG